METQVTRQMPQYQFRQSLNKVFALKVKKVIPNASKGYVDRAKLFFEEKGYAPLVVSAAWFEENYPKAGGYYMVYPNGYEMFVSAAVFEKNYTKI